jgi:threonine aldolase
MEQTPGYGTDHYCASAADKIRMLCGNDHLAVHFLVGGTQTNFTLIDAALRPHQGVLCAQTGHIHVHETGAVEATGHKVLALPSEDGKISAAQILDAVQAHYASDCTEHTVQPKLVYISNPTELGTIYSYRELEELSKVCKNYGLYLFMDGARLGYGLTASENDLTLPQIAQLCDAFYIGGTKVGALFGEAIVISNPQIGEDFRYLIKQHGGMLAKGRLLGVQFDALFTDDLYFDIAAHANRMADRLRETLNHLGFRLLVPGTSNQVFAILPDSLLMELSKEFTFTEERRMDATHRAVRFCTSWATTPESVERLCQVLTDLAKEQ